MQLLGNRHEIAQLAKFHTVLRLPKRHARAGKQDEIRPANKAESLMLISMQCVHLASRYLPIPRIEILSVPSPNALRLGLQHRNGVEEHLRIGMLGRGEDLGRGPLFHDLPMTHHHDAVAQMVDYGQIVADE